MVGAIIKMDISVNGLAFGKTKGKNFLYGFFEPGTYTFLSKSENKDEIDVKLEASKTYYLKQKVKMGVVKARTELEILSATDGKKG